MKINILAGVALLAMCSPGCVHSPARGGGSTAIEMERDWRAEIPASHSPDVHRDWRTWPHQDVQPDYREVLASPGRF